MKACWDEEPNIRPSFVVLSETLEKMVCPDPYSKKPRQIRKTVQENDEEEDVLSPELLLSNEERSLSNSEVEEEESDDMDGEGSRERLL